MLKRFLSTENSHLNYFSLTSIKFIINKVVGSTFFYAKGIVLYCQFNSKSGY